MKEVTVYEVVEKTIIVEDWRECLHLQSMSTEAINISGSDERVLHSYEEIVQPIKLLRRSTVKDGVEDIYVSYDRSFDNLMARYELGDSAVEKIIAVSDDYKSKWERVSNTLAHSKVSHDNTTRDFVKVCNSRDKTAKSFYGRVRFLFTGRLVDE